MRYGLGLANAGAGNDPCALAEFAHLAEENGWDGIFLEDYIVHWSGCNTPTYDPWVVLAAMALRTKRIRLGTQVTVPARRRPWKLAREAVTLDHLSKGRLILGVGLGDSSDISFTHFGEMTDAKQRAEMLDETLDILVGLWSGQPFSYRGKYYQVNEVTFSPTPIQIPRIPIWIGGRWPFKGPTQRAARWDGACLFKHTDDGHWQVMTPTDVIELRAYIEGVRPGSAPYDIVVCGGKRQDNWEQEREYIGSVAEAGATWWMEWIPPAPIEIMHGCIERGPLRID